MDDGCVWIGGVLGIADGGGIPDDGRMRRIVILTFPGAQSLDVAGPLEVFMATERTSGTQRYTTEVVAPVAGAVPTMSGLALVAETALADVAGPIDTFVVVGGGERGIAAVVTDAALLDEVRRLAGVSRRVVSVCSGAFVLAAAGLLDGRRATTHWSACDELARRHPAVTVEPDPIFVRDGKYATSAGVTAGIDLALALVEEDHGHAVAMGVARQLVVFLKRPGGQAQFSAALATQVGDRDDVTDVQAWIADHLDDDLSVPALATRAAMSPRHFARVFRGATGATRRVGWSRRAWRRRAGASRSPTTASTPWPLRAASAPPRRCAGRSCARCTSPRPITAAGSAPAPVAV